VADLSYARRLRVGAIVVKDDRIISMGYNGMPAGWDNACEYEEETFDQRDSQDGDWKYDPETKKYKRLKTRPEVLHAESNALSKLAKSSDSGDGADLFITHAPCIECAKLIYQSGIKRVFYSSDYRSDAGIRFLRQSGVDVVKHED
jgi:dCMP deaminase